jgi:hypothetical protein
MGGVRDRLADAAKALVNSRRVLRRRCPDFSDATLDVYERVKPYTMTSPERVSALVDAVRYIDARAVPGAIVECGVYRCGSAMAAALCTSGRDLYLFDTFEGMTEPTLSDRRASDGRQASDMLGDAGKSDLLWCVAGIEEVRANLRSTGYAEERVHLIQGRVEETVPGLAPSSIALLRLDTDWYESTRHELEHLYPRLASGGVLIIDDYGYWEGARRAVDEYFAGKLLLSRIDSTGRIAVKP